MTTTEILKRLNNGETLTRREQEKMMLSMFGGWVTQHGVRTFQITDHGRTILKLRTQQEG